MEKNESSFSFWKNIVLVVVFFTVTPITVIASLLSLFSIADVHATGISDDLQVENVIKTPSAGARVYASIPSIFPTVSDGIETSDARPQLIRQYLTFYNSPLEPHAEYIVEVADKYGLDFRLITAIAQQESNLCKVIPPNTFNCWGWGIHSEGTLGFESYEQGIETVSMGIKTEYIDKGYIGIEDIMGKYTPLSKGSWAFGVNQFMGQME